MRINIDKKIFNEKYYPMLFDYSRRWEVYKGSAGSGKSHFIAQKLVLKALQSPRRVLVCRRYAVTMKNTVYQLFVDAVTFLQINKMCKIIENEITLPNGSKFIFCGLDDETKLLSLQNISDIFIEEVFEANKDIIEQLNLRLRGKAENQQLIMAFNPISSKHWLYDFCEINPPKSFYYNQSTYKDNRYLNSEYIEQLEDLLKRNPRKGKVFVLGEWGAVVDDLVLPNHIIQDFDYMELLQRKDIEPRVGLDIGFIDPTAIVVSLYDKTNNIIYVIKEFYKRGCTLDEIVTAIEDIGIKKTKIFCDSADPRAISFFKSNGIKAVAAKKGEDSVKTGISFLQNNTIICHEDCKNVAAELENYVYIRDKKTNQLQEDKTDHDYSHSIDAIRYSYSDIYNNNKIKSEKLMLGL